MLEWNLSSNPEYLPHTDRGGCDRCQGVITIDGNTVIHNAGYDVLAHAANSSAPVSVRIGSNVLPSLPNVKREKMANTSVVVTGEIPGGAEPSAAAPAYPQPLNASDPPPRAPALPSLLSLFDR